MAEYHELASLIGKIKRAAIDVYMTNAENFYEVEGGRYRYRGSGRGMTQWCTRPGEDGQGGGDVSLDGMPDFLVNHLDDDFRNAFDKIRGQVDDIFDDLKDVPDGAFLYYEETRSMKAAEKLTPRGASTQKTPGGGSSLNLNNAALSGRINAIHGYSYRLSSRTINLFREAYADRLGAILDGQAALAATMGMAAAGQVAVFHKLREDIASFATHALASLEALAGQQSTPTGGGDAFAVGGALLSVAGLAGPGFTALAAAGIAGGLISDLWPDPPPKKEVRFSGSDLSSMMQSISDGKTALLTTPVADETAIRDALTRASAAIREAPGTFDLAPPKYQGSGPEQVGGPGTIVQDHDDMQRLAANCQLVSEDITKARELLADADEGSSGWTRPEGLGIDRTGPYEEFSALCGDLVLLTGNAATEMAEAATKLILASLDFQGTDADAKGALDQETAELLRAERDGDLLFD